MASLGRVPLAALLAACLCAFHPAAAPAAPLAVRAVRFRTAPHGTRIVLDMSGAARYGIRAAAGSRRIILTLPGCRVAPGVRDVDVRDGFVDRIRVSGMKTRVEIAIELAREASFTHFALAGTGGKPPRIVVDVSAAALRETAAAQPPAREEAPVAKARGDAADSAEGTRGAAPAERGEIRVVIIDAGHGGDAPGTISRSGIQEKTLTLRLAKMLKTEIDAYPGYRAILTREGDYDVPFVRRVAFAREKSGDVFVSLHFNSNVDRKLRGLELYILSLQASDDNAAAVAERENLVVETGADTAGFNDDLKSILYDVSGANAMRLSSVMADDVASVLRRDPPIPFRKVKQASLIVLRGITMPSILVEGGYLSNRTEAAVISKDGYLSWLAKSLADGIVTFLKDHPRAETARGN
jgi:N-acetylmuramoyl-L-alanine amidase